MSKPIISIERLGKRYTIRHRPSESPAGYRRLSEEIGVTFGAPLRKLAKVWSGGDAKRSVGSGASEEFWALRGATLDVNEGEVLGIIGRNGAGKSTLLKILSRITEPTEGRVTLRGRVASLLEVGTGFHPELTGRENVFLNGAILGMTRAEVRQRFDEIVEFAGVERFLDTPVKRYSSGMYVRLAFAVAAHLQADILLVDEVLAVGDSEFQKKCLGRMKSVARDVGRTVVFVSHNLGAVSALCDRGIVLSGGSVVACGTADAAISAYLGLTRGVGCRAEFAQDPNVLNQVLSVQVTQGDDSSRVEFDHAKSIRIAVVTRIDERAADLELSLRISNEFAVPLFTLNRSDSMKAPLPLGTTESVVELPGELFPAGTYSVTCAIRQQRRIFDLREDSVSFAVHDSGSSLALFSPSGTGAVLMRGRWFERKVSPELE